MSSYFPKNGMDFANRNPRHIFTTLCMVSWKKISRFSDKVTLLSSLTILEKVLISMMNLFFVNLNKWIQFQEWQIFLQFNFILFFHLTTNKQLDFILAQFSCSIVFLYSSIFLSDCDSFLFRMTLFKDVNDLWWFFSMYFPKNGMGFANRDPRDIHIFTLSCMISWKKISN
jgi:hypothetical protein